MWKDIKFKKLSIESKLLFVYLLSCQHRNVLGLYHLPKYYIKADIGYPIERVTKGLDELSSNGFIRYDEGSETVLVKNFLKYNPLDNANQVKGAAKVLKTIPKTPLFYNMLDVLESNGIKNSDLLHKAINKYLDDNGLERVNKDFGKGSERVRKGLPKPMGEQEEEEEEEEVEVEEEVKEEVEEKELYSPAKAEQGIPYSEIIEYLNEKTNSRYRDTTGKTRRLIKARWNEDFTLDDFIRVIDIKSSQWLNDNEMGKYLRPSTLFGTKFEGYLNEEVPEQENRESYEGIIL